MKTNSYIKKIKRENKPIVFLMIGGPGSGKSNIKKKVLEKFNYNISNFVDLDPDETLKDLYNNNLNKFDKSKKVYDKLLKHFIENNNNLIIDKVGSDYNKINDLIKKFKKKYKIYLIIVYTDLDIALDRIKKRSKKTGRSIRSRPGKNWPYSDYKKLPSSVRKYLDYSCNKVNNIFIYDNNKDSIIIFESECIRKKNKKTIKTCKINKNKSKRFERTYKIKSLKKYCDKTN